MTTLSSAWPAIAAAFLASFVEVVEAFTVVLAISSFQGWHTALLGTLAGLSLRELAVKLLGSTDLSI